MKNKAFTLLEVLVALLILVSAATIISGVNFRAFVRSAKERAYLDRVFVIQKDFLDFIWNLENKKTEKKEIKKEINKIENPEINITTELLDIDKKSELTNFTGNVKIVKTSGSWKSFDNENILNFVTFIRLKDKKK
ncbi:MAG: hypothetical protein SZ59_C0002G0164 [candidate division TM6 bacterium GW2011_GWF2_28_16]|nr:MAG: hypothetical protein SZ59_C0002G0164 [candidate division TM6 bacterium GW2011_GWF2_28_16]